MRAGGDEGRGGRTGLGRWRKWGGVWRNAKRPAPAVSLPSPLPCFKSICTTNITSVQQPGCRRPATAGPLSPSCPIPHLRTPARLPTFCHSCVVLCFSTPQYTALPSLTLLCQPSPPEQPGCQRPPPAAWPPLLHSQSTSTQPTANPSYLLTTARLPTSCPSCVAPTDSAASTCALMSGAPAALCSVRCASSKRLLAPVAWQQTVPSGQRTRQDRPSGSPRSRITPTTPRAERASRPSCRAGGV